MTIPRNQICPRPRRGYLALLSVVFLLGVGAGFGTILAGSGATARALIGVFFALPILALVLLPLHAAFRTRYDLTERSLALRAGFVIKAELEWAEIAEVVRVPFIPRVLGWGGGRGLANRFTDGVRITTRRGGIYYVSPTDPEVFVEDVLGAMGEGTGVVAGSGRPPPT